jgi:hypothetical protein
MIDPPVGPHSDVREIHAWLDELDRLRVEHARSAATLREVDTEVARAIGWLRGRAALSGELP